jgi:hypothetical protein
LYYQSTPSRPHIHLTPLSNDQFKQQQHLLHHPTIILSKFIKMRFNLPTVLLANLALSSAAAIPKPAAVEERGLLGSLLQTVGCLTGQNAKSASAGKASWIGNDGDYVTEFNNESGEDLVLVMWGSWGSWTNVQAPLITYEIANGSAVNISTVTGTSGGWAALYEDTKMVNGQISNTWGEFTYNGQYSTVDVSRLVNMNGRDMTIEGAQCVSDMKQCVFTCDSGDSCEFGYTLENCSSQPGAQSGMYAGAASGGCWVGPNNNFVRTTFN